MTEETIVAVYDTAAHAEAAVTSLKSAGVPAEAIGTHAGPTTSATGATAMAEPDREGFWSSIFGGAPDHDTSVYDRSVAGGSTVVTVKTPESHIAKVMEILESNNPIDIDERATGYGMTNTTIPAPQQPVIASAMPLAAPATADGMMQLSEENLAVGKRVVNRGGTRIRRFVVETPVEESVTLHDEKVMLERHPVTDGRPVTDSFTDKVIEMTASTEEVVVSKTAHVYEEIGLKKEATDRVETVRDTVRKEDVEIVQVPGTAATTTTNDTMPPSTSKI